MISVNSRDCSCFQRGGKGNPFVCVFECPTDLEERKESPVMGVTGGHLCLLLRILRNAILPSDRMSRNHLFRRDVCIVNAYTKGRKKRNTTTLESVLSEDKIVLCFGNKAEVVLKSVIKSMGKPIDYIKVYHLSDLGLLGIQRLDEICELLKLPFSFRSDAKVFVVAEYILRVLNGECKGMAFESFAKNFSKDVEIKLGLNLSNVSKIDMSKIYGQCCSSRCCHKCNACSITASK